MVADSQALSEHPLFALAPSPAFSLDGICFAAGQGGMWKTSDAGDTWHRILSIPAADEPIPITALTVSPTFSRDQMVFAAIPGAIGQSRDGGGSWDFVPLPMPAPIVSSLAMSPDFGEDGVAFAGTMEDGTFRTDDHGNSWLPWNFGLLDQTVLAVAVSPRFADDRVVYAGTSSGLYRSINRGRSWRFIDAKMNCPTILSLAVTTNDDAGHRAVLAGTEANGLLRLGRSEATLARLADAALPESIEAMTCDSIAKQGSLVLVFGEGRAAYSATDGATWKSLTDLPIDINEISAVSPIVDAGSGLMLFIGTDEGQVHRVALPRAR